MTVSDNLRAVLRYEGYAKVASKVALAQGEYAEDLGNIADATRSLAVKVAVNAENEKIIGDGLRSFRRLQEL